MSDDFTKNRLAWLTQVADDESLPGTASRIAIILSSLFNRQCGYAWPSIPTLARRLKRTENCVRTALHAMRDAGHLQIAERGGRKQSNHYRLILKAKPSISVEGFGEDERLAEQETPNENGGGPSTAVEPIPLKESIEKEKQLSPLHIAVKTQEMHQNAIHSRARAGLPVDASVTVRSLDFGKATLPSSHPLSSLEPRSGLNEANLGKWLSYAQKAGMDDLVELDNSGRSHGLACHLVELMPPAAILGEAYDRTARGLLCSREEEIDAILHQAFRQFQSSKTYTRDLWVADVASGLKRDNAGRPSAGILNEVLWSVLRSDKWLPKPPAIVAAYRNARAIQLHRLKMFERLLEIRRKAEVVVAARGATHVA